MATGSCRRVRACRRIACRVCFDRKTGNFQIAADFQRDVTVGLDRYCLIEFRRVAKLHFENVAGLQAITIFRDRRQPRRRLILRCATAEQKDKCDKARIVDVSWHSPSFALPGELGEF